MSKKNRHQLVIEVEFDERCGQRQAQDHVHSWFEAYGYSASGHGFEFKTIGVLTGKYIQSENAK